ncbi:hypothetical protein ABZX92_40930 [Lentzea sp. NPDC006480]|uniref:hypothetical protein n=1 Tax=Lentzea sp. NPDC006480 TaxID=3157176 RepID=UPI0033B39AB8
MGARLLGEQAVKLAVGWTSLPSWVTAVLTWLGSPSQSSSQQTIITTALTITGTLVTVYFATITFVMSSTYKDATERVRALVTRSPGGRLYGFAYVQVLLYGLVLLTYPTTGQGLNGLMFVIMVFLCCVVLLSFGRLRVQLYGLLEPAALLAVVAREIEWWTSLGSQTVRRDLSEHRARTAESLVVLGDLCALIRDRERKPGAAPGEFATLDFRAVKVTEVLHDVWFSYAEKKQVLTRRLGWCPQRSTYKDWLMEQSAEVTIALNTATQLRTRPAEDVLWVERHLAGLLAEHLGGRDSSALIRLVQGFDVATRGLVAGGMFDEARLWMDAVVEPARALMAKETPTVLSEPHLAGIADFVASAYTQAALGIQGHARHLSQDFPGWTARQVHGENIRRVGPRTIGILAELRDGFEFERRTEGRWITSNPDVAQFVARTMSGEVIDEATRWMSAFEEDLWPWAIHVGEGDSLAAGAVLSSVDEALHKWDATLSALSELFELCEAEHRNVDDTWPDLSLDDLRARLRELQERVRLPIVRLASCIRTDVVTDRPDMFGWAYHRAHEYLLDDVLSEREVVHEDLAKRLRCMVEVVTQRAEARLQTTLRRQHHTVLGSVWSEPHLMLYQLSGAALVRRLLQCGPDVFAVFDEVWCRALDENPQRQVDIAVRSLTMDRAVFMITQGGMQRSARQMRVSEVFSGAGVGFAELPMSTRRLLRRAGTFRDLEGVFVAGWLIPQAMQRGAVLPDLLPPQLADLLRALQDDEGSS